MSEAELKTLWTDPAPFMYSQGSYPLPLEDRRAALEDACRGLLRAIGEDPDREGLRETPRRWAGWWIEFLSEETPASTIFESATDQLVTVSGIRLFSLCEHHLLPFWCDAAIGYIPDGRVLGLSKFARLARKAAAGLRIQEGLAKMIADSISSAAGSRDVAVLLQGRHLCLEMRGVRTEAIMTTSVLRGVFRESAQARAEFFSLAALRPKV